MPTVEELYNYYDVLSKCDDDKLSEHSVEYLAILGAVHGSQNEKILASRFIASFFKHFPAHAEEAINAQLDLCEDDDVIIRTQAIKDLPSFCKDNKDNVAKIADVLTQLLQTDDSKESNAAQKSLLAVIPLDPKAALNGIFNQITSDEDVIREKAIKFLATKMKSLPNDIWNKELEDYMFDLCKKVLEDVTGDEFMAFMKILSGLPHASSMQGRKQIVQLITSQLDLDNPFEPKETETVDQVLQCIKQALRYLSRNVHGAHFLIYLCDQVIPKLDEIENIGEGVDTKLEFLKLAAELCTHSGGVEKLDERLPVVFDKLLDYMPLPPKETTDTDLTKEPDLSFSYVECLMYVVHQLGKQYPQFLTDETAAERLQDFQARLQYFAHGVQLHMKRLRMALGGKRTDELKSEENRLKIIALKMTTAINLMIKDLFRKPPSFKSTVTLSWKPLKAAVVVDDTDEKENVTGVGGKRPMITPIKYAAADGDASKEKRPKRGQQEYYAPPGGKFSDSIESTPNFDNPRGGRGGRGYYRGRGGRRGGRSYYNPGRYNNRGGGGYYYQQY